MGKVIHTIRHQVSKVIEPTHSQPPPHKFYSIPCLNATTCMLFLRDYCPDLIFSRCCLIHCNPASRARARTQVLVSQRNRSHWSPKPSRLLLRLRKRPSKEDGQTRKKWGIPVYDVDPEEEKVVNAMRQKELIGKTITGTFFMKDQPPHVKRWIRWNEKKCVNVYIPRDLAFEVFGGQPISGAKVKCTITALGPDTATAWRKHPQCEAFEILSRGCRYLRSPPSPRTFSSRSISSSNSSSSEEPDSWTYRRRNRTSQVPSARVPMCTRVSHKVIDLRGDGALNTRLPQSSVDG